MKGKKSNSKMQAKNRALDLQVLSETSAISFRGSIKKLFCTLSRSRILKDTGTATSVYILSCIKYLVASNGFVRSGSWELQLFDDLAET